MDTILNHEFKSLTYSSTENYAKQIGRSLRGGEIIELIGDVGAGKTTFVRGLVKGAGSEDQVSSPTFTVNKVYKAEELTIYHYDFYRLEDFKIIQNELLETASKDRAVVVLEWANEIKDSLESDYIQVKFVVTGEDSRLIKTVIPKKYSYLGEYL